MKRASTCKFQESPRFVAALTLSALALVVATPGGRAAAVDKDPLAFDAGKFTLRTLNAGDRPVRYRAYEGVVYVAKPVNPANQSLNIYVPVEYYEGKSVGGFDAEMAPVLLQNRVGGYMPALPGTTGGGRGGPGGPGSGRGGPGGPGGGGFLAEALARSMVVASPGARGSTSRGGRGENTGKAPAALVDLKAAVRYLRHNDRLIPGSAERIVANGTSAGGALSALLGAMGNSPDYETDLKAAGAADERDDIFAASCYCPITNLDHADAAYDWQFNGLNEFNAWGSRGVMTADQVKLSDVLKAQFPTYVNGLGLTSPGGTALTLDGDGNGSFKEQVKSYVIASAQKALAGGKDLSGLGWITVEGRKVTDLDFGKFVAHSTRMKSAPAFDGLNLQTPENLLFGDSAADRKHFTALGRANFGRGPIADASVVKRMNPMGYVGVKGTATAPFWRIRHGAADRDTSLAIPVILATRLQNSGRTVDFALPWGQGHGGHYDPAEFFDWVVQICRPAR